MATSKPTGPCKFKEGDKVINPLDGSVAKVTATCWLAGNAFDFAGWQVWAAGLGQREEFWRRAK